MTATARLSQFMVKARGSDILFHWTMLVPAMKILQERKFRLLTAKGTQSEREFGAHSGMDYYLSTTRSKVGGYHVGNKTSPQVIFVLDGRTLGQRGDTKVRALEYWNSPTQKQTFLLQREGKNDAYPEMEDRVFCKYPTLPADGNTVKAIHVLIPELRKVYEFFKTPGEADRFEIAKDNVKWSRLAMSVISTAKKAKIAAFFYTDHNAFLTQNPLKRVPVLSMKKYFEAAQQEPASEYDRLVAKEGKMGSRSRDAYALRELLNKKSERELSPVAKRRLERIMRAWDVKEATTSLDADFHNMRGHAHAALTRVEQDMKRLGIGSTTELVNFLQKKWAASAVMAMLRVEARRRPAPPRAKNVQQYRHAYDRDDERRQEYDELRQHTPTSMSNIKWAPRIPNWPLSKSEFRTVEQQIFQHPEWLGWWARFDWTSWQRPMTNIWFDKNKMQFTFYDVPRIFHDNREGVPTRTQPDRASLTLDLNLHVVEKPSQYDDFYAYLPTAVEVCRDYVRDRVKFIRDNIRFLEIPCFIRYGRWRDEERSQNFLASKEEGQEVWENGVSVYNATLDVEHGHWEIDLDVNENTINGTLSSLFYGTKKIYLVTGKQIGEGSDGEPLLKNVKLLKELDKKDVKVSGVFDDDD